MGEILVSSMLKLRLQLQEQRSVGVVVMVFIDVSSSMSGEFSQRYRHRRSDRWVNSNVVATSILMSRLHSWLSSDRLVASALSTSRRSCCGSLLLAIDTEKRRE